MQEPTAEPTSRRSKGGGPIEGSVASAPPGPEATADRRLRVGALVMVGIVIAAFVGGLVYGFLGGDPNAPFVLPWEARPSP